MQIEMRHAGLMQEFTHQSTEYYSRVFARLSEKGWGALQINLAASLLGPLWAAARGLWWLFWVAAVADVVALTLIGKALWNEPQSTGLLGAGLVLMAVLRLLLGYAANIAYQAHYSHWRVNRSLNHGLSAWRFFQGGLLMVATYPLTIYRFALPEVAGFIAEFPSNRNLALGAAEVIDAAVEWLTINLEGLFESITIGVRSILDTLELLFVGTPWPVMALIILLLAWRMAGTRVLIFTAASLLYLGLFGFWEKAMITIALVAASVFICLLVGTPIGIWCAKSRRANAVISPILDMMQTMPSFVYLIPAIAFFSIGKPPAVLATVVFAMPPMIRLTTLGIQQVPEAVKEAMLSFGASPRQILFKAELPLAVPSIMTGVNQSIMMSLSMVVVAALIGAGGLGYDVLFSLQHLETGKGLLAGIAIVLSAMVLDRIVQGRRNKT
ncbi:MAG: proline/glycine betaine ABC transporter permease [Oceanospirillaceae bacterium]|nr:proline/glycine betaine ABC transporter permease [Oceanospirillaceae bacterium]